MHRVIESKLKRRFPIGAEIMADGCAHFRVWAPKCRRVHVVLADERGKPDLAGSIRMKAEEDGYYSAEVPNAKQGMQYGFRLDNRLDRVFADPASRFQPDGPAGLSQIIDPTTFRWSDADWKGIGSVGQVVYEMHFGTFTPEGTYAAAAKELAELKRIGITVIEVMPLADFPGRFGWGYDGVLMFAPTRLYGVPDDFRKFVDEAHAVGLGVILDVVYNHFGNVDNYLGEFSADYTTHRYANEWSSALNFDGDRSAPVREFFETNARYWIEEFHLDGFRYDATHSIHDASADHIIAAINRSAREKAGNRSVYLVAENETEDVRFVRPIEQGGYGMDAAWNDDFHHSAHVRLSGNNPAYYSDYLGTVEELASAVKRGFIYQGQRSQWQKKRRGTPTFGLPATAFVSFLENHDQVANSATGQRIHMLTTPGKHRAMTALWLLMPQTPLFFQGQEFGSSKPFLYFADFTGEMAKNVARGRAAFMSQFPELSSPAAQRKLPNPCDESSFQKSKLNLTERETNKAIYDLHIDLLKLRREDHAFARQDSEKLDTAILSADGLAIRFLGQAHEDRLLLVNFGGDLLISPVAEPLLAPPVGCRWETLWNSNAPRYGGPGVAQVERDDGWHIAGESAVVLHPLSAEK